MNTSQQRFDELTIALQYDSYGEKYLTDFDRMFIHTERSALLNGRDWKIPEDTEKRVQEKLSYIRKYNWECPY